MRPAQRRCDVVVVGCGPAGSTAAAVVARAGLAVTIVERREVVGEPLQCAELAPAMLPLDRSLVAEVACQSITGFDLHVGGECLDSLAAPSIMLDRPRLDRRLAERAVAAGAELAMQRHVQRVDVSEAGAAVHCRHLDSARREVIDCRVVVGADGCRSTVASSLGLAEKDAMAAVQVQASLRRPTSRAGLFFDRALYGGYGWLFPKSERANVGVGLAARRGDELGRLLAAHLALLERLGLIDDCTEAPCPVGGLVPCGGPSEQLVTGCALLVGDAAGLANPINGAGILSALVSGEIAGKVIVEALRIGDYRSLADYESEVALALPLSRAARKRARLLSRWSQAPLESLVREAWLDGPR